MNAKSPGRFLFAILAGLLALLFAIVLFAVVGHLRAKLAANSRIAQLQAANQPTSGWELNTYYDQLVQGDDEAASRQIAEAWQSAIRFVETKEYQKATTDLPILGSGASPVASDPSWPEAPAVRLFLEQFADSIGRLHELSPQLGPLRYPSNFARGFESNPEHLSTVRAVARLFRFEANVAAHARDTTAYLESVTSLLRLSDSLRVEPTGMAMLVRLAIEATAGRTVQETVNQMPLTGAQAQELSAAFDQRRHRNQLRLSFVGERAVAIPLFIDLGAYSNDAPQSFTARYSDLRYYLDVTDQMIEACDYDWPELWRETHREQEALERARQSNSTITRFFHALTLLAAPSFEAQVKAAMREEFRCRACRTALALEQFRQTHKAYPDQLSELVPSCLAELPDDPFDGRPLRYRTTPEGYVLYSVGQDGQDHGGQMQRGGMQPDIAFQVPIPPEEE